MLDKPPDRKQSSDCTDDNHGTLLGLEILRFVSTIAVLVWHYQHFFYLADKPNDFSPDKQPFFSVLSFFYNYGYFGVQVFWCISGFIFFWKYSADIFSRSLSASNYFNLRFSRLYPLHILTLLIVLCLQYLYFAKRGFFFVYQNNDFHYFILQIFLASNWLESAPSFNGPIWSISLETLVYGCFFILVRYFGVSIRFNIMIVVMSQMLILYVASNQLFYCMSFFYMGGISALALNYYSKSILNRWILGFLISLIIVFSVLLFFFSFPVWLKPIYFLLIYTPILLFVFGQKINMPNSIAAIVKAAGNLTYSCYLLHFPIQLFLVSLLAYLNLGVPYYQKYFFLFFIFVTLILSRLCYLFFEWPAQQWLRRKMLDLKS